MLILSWVLLSWICQFLTSTNSLQKLTICLVIKMSFNSSKRPPLPSGGCPLSMICLTARLTRYLMKAKIRHKATNNLPVIMINQLLWLFWHSILLPSIRIRFLSRYLLNKRSGKSVSTTTYSSSSPRVRSFWSTMNTKSWMKSRPRLKRKSESISARSTSSGSWRSNSNKRN